MGVALLCFRRGTTPPKEKSVIRTDLFLAYQMPGVKLPRFRALRVPLAGLTS
jgi:hypothetical protein